MKKTIAIIAILAMSTLAHSATDNWYVGFGYDGVSVKKDIDKDYAMQVIYGGFGALSGLKMRGLYKFQKNKNYNLYGFGGLVYGSDSQTQKFSTQFISVKTETDITTKGVEFGAGIEYDLRQTMDNNIPLFVSIEVGYRASTTDMEVTSGAEGSGSSTGMTSEIDHSGVIGGVWFHYRF